MAHLGLDVPQFHGLVARRREHFLGTVTPPQVKHRVRVRLPDVLGELLGRGCLLLCRRGVLVRPERVHRAWQAFSDIHDHHIACLVGHGEELFVSSAVAVAPRREATHEARHVGLFRFGEFRDRYDA